MRVLLVDDHPLTRLGARTLIEREWPDALVAEAETLADALQRLAARNIDVVVLDIELPDATGVDSIARVLRAAGTIPVLVMSQNDEATYAERALQLGARGYLPKGLSAGELVSALRRILGGGRYVTPAQADRLVSLLEGRRKSALPHEALSTQEMRVVQLLAAGRTPAQIAATMHLSAKTVGSYRARIFEKTGWRSTAELTKYCVAHGLTEPA